MNENTDIADKRKFMSDEEFEDFKRRVKFSFYGAGELVPSFNPDTQALTNEQIEQLKPFLFKKFTPYLEAKQYLNNALSSCVDKNHSHP